MSIGGSGMTGTTTAASPAEAYADGAGSSSAATERALRIVALVWSAA